MDNDDQISIRRRYMNYNVSTVADGGCYTSCNIGNLVVHPMVSYRRRGWNPMVEGGRIGDEFGGIMPGSVVAHIHSDMMAVMDAMMDM